MVAELAAAATVVAGVAGKMVPYLLDYLGKNHKLRADLKEQIDSLGYECNMISAFVEEDTVRRQTSGKGTHKLWIAMVRDLAYEIDDTMDRFTRQIGVTLEPDVPWYLRTVYKVKTRKARNKFAAAIRRVQKKLEEVSKLRDRYSGTLQPEAPPEGTVMHTASPVGMGAALGELKELIRETPQGQHDELRVISVVGFGGIGKTQLVKHVYDTVDESQYPVRAWVPAADKDEEYVIEEILRQLGMHSTITTSGVSSGGAFRLEELRTAIENCLRTKRFFIVIDDIRASVWNRIRDAFPMVPRVGNRIIVTTATQSIAKACSPCGGDVYVMRTLAKKDSRKLFCKEASLEYPPPDGGMQLGSESEEALAKCDGLPLAVVTTAQFLQNRCNNQESWAFLCRNLGRSLETDPLLASMKRVLVHSYTSLGSQDVKTCLLYLGIYPCRRPIRRASLIRRWLAEGFITKGSGLVAASNNFDELVNQSIIQPIDTNSSNSAEMKTCQTHGMMLEFILHSTDNFVTMLDDKATLPSNVRWLSLYNRTNARFKMNSKDLRLVRSLTIYGEAHKSVLDFSKYRLIRVLDLEECQEHLEDKHLKDICSNLFLLRYLSLRSVATVTVLPKEIKKLQLLETLDVRGTSIKILPREVMKLPCLIHLFGKFKLEDVGRRMGKLQTWLSENSNLEKLAGFVGDKSQEFTQLMEHMKHLTKVKIWCESTADVSRNLSHLSEAIKEFIQRGTDSKTSLSLSLNFSGEWCQDLLNFSLENGNSCYLSSLKLRGNNLFSLPPFVTMLTGLTKLCLSFPHHQLSSDILDALSRVSGLEYLKLTATQLDALIIEQGAFRSLRHLCVVVEVMTELEIQEGALLRLDSLCLLCKNLNGFSSTAIQSLPRLKEVTLYDGLSDEAKQECKKAVKNHPRRPKLLFKLMGSKPAVGTSTAAITTDTIAQEDVVESEPVESTAATATDTIAQENVVESEPVENSESPATPPTDMTLSMRMSPGAISAEEPIQVVTSEIGSEPAAETLVASSTDMTLSVTTPLGAIFTGEPVQIVTSDTGSGSAAEISPVATTTDKVAQEVAVQSELVENSESPAALPTDMVLSVAVTLSVVPIGESVQVVTSEMGSELVAEIPVNHEAFATAQQEYLVQVDGDDQHDDHEIEDIDNTHEPNDFASENGPSTNMASFKKEMEGVAV